MKILLGALTVMSLLVTFGFFYAAVFTSGDLSHRCGEAGFITVWLTFILGAAATFPGWES